MGSRPGSASAPAPDSRGVAPGRVERWLDRSVAALSQRSPDGRRERGQARAARRSLKRLQKGLIASPIGVLKEGRSRSSSCWGGAEVAVGQLALVANAAHELINCTDCLRGKPGIE
jgi:hypothetical protein